MITIERTSPADMEAKAARAGIDLPIEQSAAWAGYQSGIDGRTPWGCLLIRRGDALLAVVSLIDYETHGYHYLRSVHGPAWAARPDEATEREAVDAILAFVRKADHKVAFLRIDLWHMDAPGAFPVLSTVPYNETVVVDLTGGDEAILGRMKKRGRRDVRKALRESPAVCADETGQALADFAEYYDVMVETAARDGFSPAPMSDYTDMVAALGPDHCRVFAARVDGRVVAWAIVTINGERAVYYYACMRTEVMRALVPDKLLYSFCCELGARGCTSIDLMGIGNDFAPSLKSLNTFKTKFAEDTVTIAAARDLPVKRGLYGVLRLVKRLRGAMRRG
ncbi:lipid II:glycine glycyltransferase FemX [Bifidobacterium samirii]|uniref:Peptidoglycan bridge formation protein FemAB n=1 Tax=Bifidobacterium samirii TaxID=2306974 RepID=A0A430FUX0_9BIFI|nr:GNAT family N-acetyltransferase [Bifidobacterium samirii]RSX57262.1 peptidoglycan bridge formation protein FemAB [Bifidobacterium samirii]